MEMITEGVMNMPLPDDPSELGAVEWMQIKSRMRDAGKQITGMREALENPPDQIEIYRAIKKSGARKHGEIAKVIADLLVLPS